VGWCVGGGCGGGGLKTKYNQNKKKPKKNKQKKKKKKQQNKTKKKKPKTKKKTKKKKKQKKNKQKQKKTKASRNTSEGSWNRKELQLPRRERGWRPERRSAPPDGKHDTRGQRLAHHETATRNREYQRVSSGHHQSMECEGDCQAHTAPARLRSAIMRAMEACPQAIVSGADHC